MITIVFKMTIKKEKEEAFRIKVIPQLVFSANANNCREYIFYQNLKNSREFILHEKWNDKSTLHNHLNNLVTLLGKKVDGSILPKKLEEYFASTENILYKE